MTNLVVEAVEDAIRALPDRPGIYVFRDARGKPLYVGKARSLRKRATSYLRGPFDARIGRMLMEARRLDSVLADTEAEALALENSWIKTKQPRYNIRLRDDKTYPYLKLTLRDDYPRIVFTRRIVRDGGEYFGPYLPAGLARRAIKLVQKLFQVRVCHIEIDGSLPRPCLYHGMRRCLGPCVEGLTDLDAYTRAVDQAKLFLAGRNDQLLKELKGQMWAASEAQDFEEAARLRDLIAEVEEIGARRNVASVRGEDVDIYGIHSAGGNVAVTVLVMRGGQVMDRRELFWEGEDEVDPSVLLSEVLPQIYDVTPFVPKELHLPVPIEGGEALAEWLGEKKGERVYVRFPSRGQKADRVALAVRNAEMAFRRRFRAEGRSSAAVRSLVKHLDLGERPQRIEGFDISHFQGAQTVASLVVWEEGRMRKGDYRSFNIRDLDGPDDFLAMNQAVARRYRRVLEEVGVMPDLILIDGGRGQLNAALEALSVLGVEETPVVGLAKREEELYLPGRPMPLRLERSDPGLQLLQEIRDESHRFAVARHRRRRKKATLRSRLDEIPGIGPKRRRQLLTRFGSAAGVAAASQDELAPILGPKLAMRVSTQLIPSPDEGAGDESPDS
ncbi:MAG: excinuclease ABC subunit UvrC [Thermoanaerobaculia bacterium]|nr:excinuclease ABC subunit UvrC [Thermoanaerobaculia bacterium]